MHISQYCFHVFSFISRGAFFLSVPFTDALMTSTETISTWLDFWNIPIDKFFYTLGLHYILTRGVKANSFSDAGSAANVLAMVVVRATTNWYFRGGGQKWCNLLVYLTNTYVCENVGGGNCPTAPQLVAGLVVVLQPRCEPSTTLCVTAVMELSQLYYVDSCYCFYQINVIQ